MFPNQQQMPQQQQQNPWAMRQQQRGKMEMNKAMQYPGVKDALTSPVPMTNSGGVAQPELQDNNYNSNGQKQEQQQSMFSQPVSNPYSMPQQQGVQTQMNNPYATQQQQNPWVR